jgi:hypothetical protein
MQVPMGAMLFAGIDAHHRHSSQCVPHFACMSQYPPQLWVPMGAAFLQVFTICPPQSQLPMGTACLTCTYTGPNGCHTLHWQRFPKCPPQPWVPTGAAFFAEVLMGAMSVVSTSTTPAKNTAPIGTRGCCHDIIHVPVKQRHPLGPPAVVGIYTILASANAAPIGTRGCGECIEHTCQYSM